MGAGNTMGELLNELKKYERSFPIGLSSNTGIGYILSGGISPLSRSQGLAIDQIVEISGIYGNGKSFTTKKPTIKSTNEEKVAWRGLLGAGAFLGVITSVKVKTQPILDIIVWQEELNKYQLSKAILKAENFSNFSSLQWIWDEKIKVYGVFHQSNSSDMSVDIEEIKKIHELNKNIDVQQFNGINNMPSFGSSNSMNNLGRCHSEVVGLLSREWGELCPLIVEKISKLIKQRPDPRCYIAAQQLGGATQNIHREETSFIHRDSIWKPWISAAWPAGDIKKRDQSMKWLKESWETLAPYCKGVHLAQMHQHLDFHQKEVHSAFMEWLPELRSLKKRCDPYEVLPSL